MIGKTESTTVLQGLGIGTIALGVLVLLPFLGILFFAMRALFFVALVAALAGLMLVPSFRRWLVDLAFEAPAGPHGLVVPRGVRIHPRHAWARWSGRTAVVGADDLLQRTISPVDRVELPSVGAEIAKGEPVFRLWSGARSVAVRAPVGGRVTATNDRLGAMPRLVNSEPYGGGWAVRMQTEKDAPVRDLRQDDEARTWIGGEMDRLIAILGRTTAGSPTLADGGAASTEFRGAFDVETWDRIRRELFGDE